MSDINIIKAWLQSTYNIRIGEPLGRRGAFGSVYEATHKNQEKAIKIINKDEIDLGYTNVPPDIMRQLEEAEALNMFKMKRCPNVVQVDFYEKERFDGTEYLFIVMEKCKHLSIVVEELKKNFDQDKIIDIAMDLTNALIALKKKDIAHRDIKVANLFFTEEGGKRIYKIGDFGVSREGGALIGTGTRVGDSETMAPEIYNDSYRNKKNAGSLADIYSLGIVLYQLLNDGECPQAVSKTCGRYQEDFDPPRHGSESLKQIVIKMTKYDSSNRYRDPDELRRALSNLIGTVYEKREFDGESVEADNINREPGVNEKKDFRLKKQNRTKKVKELISKATLRRGRAPLKRNTKKILVGSLSIAAVAIVIFCFAVFRSPGGPEVTPTVGNESELEVTTQMDAKSEIEARDAWVKEVFDKAYKKAKQGDPAAQCEVADYYAQGTGVKKNKEKALYWYKKAAEQDNLQGEYELASMYTDKQDFKEAIYWYKKIVEQGDKTVIVLLGNCYRFYGDKVNEKKYYKKAVYWFKKAAVEEEDGVAQYMLGDCYENGIGVKSNLKKAIYWYEKAVEADESLAAELALEQAKAKL